jgi:type I restriction enzyme S subunit
MKTNWQTKKINEVCSVGAGNSAPQKKEFFIDGKYPFFRTSDVGGIHIGKISDSNDYLNDRGIKGLKLFKRGTILLPKSGASTFLNHRVVMAVDGYVSSHLATIKVDKKILDNYFIFYFLQEIRAQDLIQDHKYPSLNLPVIGSIEIPLPPLLEQQRVVKILDETFEKIETIKENAKKSLQNSKELFESYSQSVFDNPGKNWERGKIIDVFQIKPPKREAKEKLKDNDLVSFVPMEDLEKFSKEFVCVKERKLKDVSGSYTYFADEDVLLAKITPCFENGKLGIAKNLKNGIGFGSSEYIVFRSNGRVAPDYLYYFLARDKFRKEGAKRMSGAVGHKRVSKEFIEESILLFPKSLSEQKSIVAKLDSLSAETKKLETIYKQKLADLEELKKSILKKAFSGEL